MFQFLLPGGIVGPAVLFDLGDRGRDMLRDQLTRGQELLPDRFELLRVGFQCRIGAADERLAKQLLMA